MPAMLPSNNTRGSVISESRYKTLTYYRTDRSIQGRSLATEKRARKLAGCSSLRVVEDPVCVASPVNVALPCVAQASLCGSRGVGSAGVPAPSRNPSTFPV
ncbi:hypothetical protein J6590_019010 [Homalodisca vitripennis]|nr:hypothetical protein J6590_019010 [Homalodisca vitripennis]